MKSKLQIIEIFSCKKWGKTLQAALIDFVKDIVPLVDNSELQQQDEGGNHIIEIIFAVVELCKRAPFQ